MIDAHCHLGFLLKDPTHDWRHLVRGESCASAEAGLALAGEAEPHGNAAWGSVGYLSGTVLPGEYAPNARRFAGAENIVHGVGLHPWWVPRDPTCAIELAHQVCELLPETPLASEVGLDFSPRHRESADTQMGAFRLIAQECARLGARMISMHSVQASAQVLEVLRETTCIAGCICVFHWFSGSSLHLREAIDSGCRFSINPRMLATKKGREYARVIPQDRLLLESDLPDLEGGLGEYSTLPEVLVSLVDGLAGLRGLEPGEMLAIVEANEGRLLRELGLR